MLSLFMICVYDNTAKEKSKTFFVSADIFCYNGKTIEQRRCIKMTSKVNTVMKYAGAAMAVGGAAMLGSAAMGAGTSSIKKKAKKTANKAIDAMDSVLTSVQSMIK